MTRPTTLHNLADRFARFVHNLRFINRLAQKLALSEERHAALEHISDTSQQRLDALELSASTGRQRLDALELSASTGRQRLDALEPRVDALEPRLDALEPRLDALEPRLDALEPRLDSLELTASAGRQRLVALELSASAIGQRLEILETSVTPTIEQAFIQEIHDELQRFQKRIDQEKLFTPATARRPKLAYVSPLPPERSGISDYSAELLPELARYFDIEVIVVQPTISDCWINAYCPVRGVAWFQQHAADYERVVYQFGNSPFHSHMFALLRQHPGVVVLHDFFLGSVLAYEESTGAMPGAWTNALYHSHGYLALKASFSANGIEFARKTYPCNLEILQLARGVIVHSGHPRQLARDWYGAHAADDWAVIPHLRRPAPAFDRMAARKTLGIGESAFVVCSFGFIDPVKLSHRLLGAWLASRLRTDPDCELVLVGANHPAEYGAQLAERIRNSGHQDRIRITGWVDETTYKQYLQAADACVQLRSISRGETSGAVLHCLNYGLPTIVNANGSLADLPQDVVWQLPGAFDDTALVTAMEALRENSVRRVELGSAARQFIQSRHDPRQCARQYAEFIDATYKNVNQPTEAEALSDAGQHAPRQLLLDVSTIMRNDLQTGIERVVRAQLSELLNNPPPGFRVEPVYLTDQGGPWHYRYARSYACKMLDIKSAKLTDAPIEIRPGDVYYAADFFPEGVIKAAQSGLYAKWRAFGVTTNFLIHDLLPVVRPDFFPDQANALHAQWLACIAENADNLICISHQVADEVRVWMSQRGPVGSNALNIAVVHHGADLAASVPTSGIPAEADRLLQQIAATPSFLMVGTIEPRKGHLQTLLAFEQLWREGARVKLVIVGQEGWTALPHHQRRTIPEIVDRVRNHPELGKRLFWLHGISDEYLQKVYGVSTCLVFASEGEGFGLPLIEAAQHKLPIIARDLPVFREVAQKNAYYFDGLAADDLASAIRAWLDLHAQGVSPASEAMPWITWKQNVGQLLGVLAGQRPERI
jgi:glycosyltransferase involved in cell wall biosynthesis